MLSTISRANALMTILAAFVGPINAPPVPQKAEWSFQLQAAPGPSHVAPVWSFAVDAPAPAEWCFAVDTETVLADAAAWRFFQCDEPGKGECEECRRERLPTYRQAYDASKASGKWICLKVGGTLAEAEAERAKAESLGMEFAWSERPGATVDAETVGVHRYQPPSGTPCVVYPSDYVLPPNCPTGQCFSR